MTATLELDQVLDTILTQLKQVVTYDSAAVLLLQDELLFLAAGRGFPEKIREPLIGRYFPANNSLFDELRRSQKPLCLPDAQADRRFANWGDFDYIRGWIGVPLIARGEVIGVLTVDNRQVGAYGEADTNLAEAFANQAATVIENARLYEAEQHARQMAEALRSANLALSQSLDLDTILATLLDFLVQLVPYDTANVMLLQEDNQIVMHTLHGHERWADKAAIKKITFNLATNSVFQTLVDSQRGLLIADTHAYPGWEIPPSARYVRNWIGVPLIGGGKTIGFYSLNKAQPGFFTKEHLQVAETLAAQAAVAIQNAQLFQETHRSAEELEVVSEILRLLNTTPDIIRVFPEIATVLKRITNCARGSITLLDESRERGRMFALDQPRTVLGQGALLNLAETAAATDVLTGRPHLTPDLATEAEFPVEKLLYEAGYRSRINLPLYGGKRPIGSLNLAWLKPHGYDLAYLPLLSQIADAIALAIERSRLFDETNRWVHQLTILNELGRQMTGLLETRELCQTVAEHLCHAFSYLSVSIFTINMATREIVLQAIVGPQANLIHVGKYRQRLGEGLIGHAAEVGEKVVANDTRQHPHFRASTRIDVRSEVVLPLRAGSDIVGVLNVDSDEVNAFDESDVTILTIAADQLAVALEKARLFEETRRRTSELEAVADVSTALRAAHTMEEMLPIILEKAIQVVGGVTGSIFLVESKGDELVERGRFPNKVSLPVRRHRFGEGITGHVASTGEIYITDDMLRDPMFHLLAGEAEKLHEAKGSISLPLRTQERIIGVMHIGLPPQHTFSDSGTRLLTALSEIGGSALDRVMIMETLEMRVKERTRELAEANTRLQELDRLKSKFVSDVSHELRTPITNLALYLDLFKQAKPEKHPQYVEVLRRQGERLTHLIEDILSLSRLELGQDKVEFKAVDLNAIVEPVITAHLPRIEVTGLALTCSLQPDLPPVAGERNQLAQVITNLLANAINYTPAGGIGVDTYWDGEREQVCLAVSDSGVGITEEDQEHLFDRFYRGQHASQSNIPGTGLGLAIVKEIVDLHGGSIKIQSKVDKGSTVWVWFPAEEEINGRKTDVA